MKLADIVPLHLADFRYPDGHPLAGENGSVYGFAVPLADGVVLVDTGVGTGNAWIDEHYAPRVRAVRDAMREATLDPGAVRLVINTHLHFDHSGQNAAFPGVPIAVQQAEWDVAWGEGYTITEWLDFEGARYEKVRGDAEVAPGVSVLATPGHTPGHQSVLVRAEDGLALLVGQAAQDARDFATREADASLAHLRALNADRVHFSHDRAVLKKTLPHDDDTA